MDAKPQRPRVLRLNDENVPPASSQQSLGKTLLHGRTKSSPALSSLHSAHTLKPSATGFAASRKATSILAARKVLGESNKNATMSSNSTRDDSEVGKASPQKALTAAMDRATLARPAARPLVNRPTNNHLSSAAPSNAVPSAAAQHPTDNQTTDNQVSNNQVTDPQATDKPAADANQEQDDKAQQTLKAAPKKSIKIFQGAAQDPSVAAETVQPSVAAPSAQIQAPVAVDQITQPVVAPPSVPIHLAVDAQQTVTTYRAPVQEARVQAAPGFASQQEYLAYLHHNSVQIAAGAQYAQTQRQYYEDEDYYTDDGYTTARSFVLPGDGTATFEMIGMPRHTERTIKEIDDAKFMIEKDRTPEDIEDDQWDQSMVAEYSEEIFSYLRQLEGRLAPNPRYMDVQTEMRWSMRGVLVDWVIQVHQRFNLLPETLFLTVNYIDRFLSAKVVSVTKLQLVGATAIFVAAKYEEVQCPTIQEIVYMVDGGYTAEELLKAERFMLSMLQFELGWPGPMSFLRRISKADDYDLETRTLAKYFLEVTLMDERFLASHPSYLAAGAHCLARMMLQKGEWTMAHVCYSEYTYGQLHQLLVLILECCENPIKHHKAVYDKFTDKRYKRASLFVQTEMQRGYQIPPVCFLASFDGF